MRIRLEADAVLLILGHIRLQTLEMAVSSAHLVEATANPDPARREQVQAMLNEIGVFPGGDLALIRNRAENLHLSGLGLADAAHVAFAESYGCDFVTVDDRLLRQLQRSDVQIWFGTPMAFL